MNEGSGADLMVGGSGVDTLEGDEGDSRVSGGGGNDLAVGLEGSDRVLSDVGGMHIVHQHDGRAMNPLVCMSPRPPVGVVNGHRPAQGQRTR